MSCRTSTRQPNTPGIKKPHFNTIQITHPFHPDYGSKFEVTSIQNCWGEKRVAYYNKNGSLRSIPITWTEKKPFDPFLEVSSGRSILHQRDIKGLLTLVHSIYEQNNHIEGGANE